jgi:hypothetical protein
MWHGSARSCNSLGEICAVVLLLLAAALLLPGCGTSTADKQKEYKAQYKEALNEFQTQVAKDEVKAKTLLESNDATGLIKLNNQRLAGVNATFDKIADLYPPADLRKVHAETLYYLIAVADQLQAQNAYFEAVLAGKPSGDLETIAKSATAKAQSLGAELGLDLQKANITIKSIPSSTPGQTQSAPSSSGGGTK